jgi:endonuclease/exonuclease/phosphatase family metal-dependent hydrolase
MKRGSSMEWASVVLGAFLMPFLPSMAEGQQFLKVMTYNIQGMRPGSDPATRLTNIVRNLKRINPDIIGLQEVNETKGGGGGDNQAKAIAESLSAYFGVPYQWNCGPGHDAWSGQFTEYNAIVTKHIVRGTGSQILEFSDYQREVIWNLIETPVGNVHFFTTHLSTVGPAPRARQGAEVRAYVQAQELTEEGIATIVTGDFNDVPSSAVIRAFTVSNRDSGYSDSYADMCPGSSGYTVDALSPVSRIDYVFLKRTSSLVLESSSLECNAPYVPGKYCSDHYAVVTILSSRPFLYNRTLLSPPSLLGSRDTISLELTSTSRQSVTISSATVHQPAFSILYDGSFPITFPQQGSHVTMRIAFAPTASGLHRDTIAIFTDNRNWPELTIPIEGRGVSSIVPSLPGRCYAISRSPGADILWSLNLTDATASQIGVTGVAGIAGISVRPSTGDLYAVIPDSLQSNLLRVCADSGYAVASGAIPVSFARAIAFGEYDTCYAGTLTGHLYKMALGQSVPIEVAHLDDVGIGGVCYDRITRKIYVSTYVSPFSNDSIYVVDPGEGVFHFVGSTGLWTVTSSLTIDSSGQLYGLTGTDWNLVIRIDKGSGSGEPASYDPLQGFSAMTISPDYGPSGIRDRESDGRFAYQLSGNYPNPCNPTTTIGYTVGAVSGQQTAVSGVRLAVYDLLGREVAVLVNEKQVPGTYYVQFDAARFASGVYFYSMQAGGFVQTRKLIVLR